MILKEISNTNYKNDNVPSILKPLLVFAKVCCGKRRSQHLFTVWEWQGWRIECGGGSAVGGFEYLWKVICN